MTKPKPREVEIVSPNCQLSAVELEFDNHYPLELTQSSRHARVF